MAEETPKERVDRELIELLNELRVLLPGVQVLFAFLLTVPFNAGFANASTFHRTLLLVALLASALAVGLLVAPAAQHRILFRAQEKQRLLWRSNLFAISGVLLLAIAVVGSVLLVVDYLFLFLVASISAGLVAAVLRVGMAAPADRPAGSVPARRAARSGPGGRLVDHAVSNSARTPSRRTGRVWSKRSRTSRAAASMRAGSAVGASSVALRV